MYGVLSHSREWFPIPLLRTVYVDLKELLPRSDDFLSTDTLHYSPRVEALQPDTTAPGLLMIVGSIDGTRDTFVRVIDRNGTVIHEWTPRWTEIWGKREGNFPVDRRPRGNNSAIIDGIDILPDASFVANFSSLSTFRMNICGEVMWKLDNLGHHAVFIFGQRLSLGGSE